MIDFSVRHPGPELMDSNDVPAEDLFMNYRELHTVNKWLGGYRITFKGLTKLLTSRQQTYSILDVGSGGGDMVCEVNRWAQRRKLHVQLTGVDLSDAAIHYSAARQKCEAQWLREDVFHHLNRGVKYDVIMSTLFMHHLSNARIAELLQLMQRAATVGIIINDLQRNKLAYHSIRWITGIFSHSYLVKNDAPMSVLRGFRKDEWKTIFDRAEIVSPEIYWEWAFRYLILIRKNNNGSV